MGEERVGTQRAQVLLITGTVGVGKTTVSYEVRLRLKAASVAHALIDDEFALFHPYPPNDLQGETTRLAALAALWGVYRARGIQRLVLSRVVETDEAVHGVANALDAGEIQVFRLVAPLSVVNDRIEGRAVPTAAEWCRARAAELETLWRDEPLSGMMVDASGRSATATADEIVRLSGWVERFAHPS